MNRFLLAGLITLGILGVIFAAILFLDDARISVLNHEINDLALQSESNRVLFFYTQVFNPTENTAFCDAINQSGTIRSDQGDLFFSRLAEFESANLVGDFEQLKKKYVLNRIELWLYTTLQTESCDTNFVPVLFFYSDKYPCTECQVQGEILEELRSECSNVKIFAVSVDEGIELVPVIRAQFGVTVVPAVVVNNQTVFTKLTGKQDLLEQIQCVPSTNT